jgi:hypothetical protein
MAMTESAQKNPFIISLLFDKKLIELGKWPKDIYSKLEEWNEVSDYEMQRMKAASLITTLILKILGSDCSSKGKIRARRLGRALANFEQIIISTRGLERKFYRDHLNHIIRVALLARAIGQKPPFNLRHEDLDRLVLASLFHDVAYPLSEMGQSMRFSLKAIRDCYNIVSRASPIPEIKFDLNYLSLLPLSPLERRKKMRELDHALLSSLEFASYLEKNKGLIEKYIQVMKAIALHSPSNCRRISSLREKSLAVLVLADELQDWGRPIEPLSRFSFVPKIEEFKLESYRLEGRYETKKIVGFSTLKQISGKTPSLTRIRMEPKFNFNLKFSFDDFEDIYIDQIENSLQQLFNKCHELERSLFHPSYFNSLYKNNSVFENEYYGKSIPRKDKLKLFELLNANELPSKSPFRNFRLLSNSTINELLIINIKIDQIRNFQFQSSSSGVIELRLVTESNDVFDGEIRRINDHRVFELAMFLLSEIRFFNICIQKLARFRAKKYPAQIGFEGFPTNPDLLETMKNTKETRLPEYCRLLISLRDSVFNEGIFFFKS